MCVEDRLNIFYKHEKEERVSGSQREVSPNELVKDVRTTTTGRRSRHERRGPQRDENCDKKCLYPTNPSLGISWAD